MTNEERQLIDSLADMDDAQIAGLSGELLCKNIRQLLAIISELDLRVVIKPVGPERVLRTESSLPQDPIVVVHKRKEVGRAHDGLV